MSTIVLIDDTSPSIQYSGPWIEVVNTQNDIGTFGPPFQNTLHGVAVNANFSFPFNGSAVFVYGTSITANVSGSQDPTWECYIDDTCIGWSPASPTSENNWILCGGSVQDGPHLLTVIANVSNQHPFWFDQIQYTPSPNVSLNQSLLRIDSSDSAIQYGSGWQSLVQSINISFTEIAGSKLTYQFSGTSISWVGTTIPFNSEAPVTYAVDDQDPTEFLVPTSSNSTDNYNQTLFETGTLSPGQHKLVVTYYGNSSVVPLTLNYFVQQGAPFSSNNTPTSTSAPSGSSSSLTSNVGPGSSTTIHIAIISSVVGVVVVVVVVALFLFKRIHRRAQAKSENSRTVPSVVVNNIINGHSANPNFLPQKYNSNDQSFQDPSQSISSNFTQKGQPSDPASTSSSDGIPPLAPPPRSWFGSQTNPDEAAEREPLMQPLPSPRSLNDRLLRHKDSGVPSHVPTAEDDVVEIPPFYTTG